MYSQAILLGSNSGTSSPTAVNNVTDRQTDRHGQAKVFFTHERAQGTPNNGKRNEVFLTWELSCSWDLKSGPFSFVFVPKKI
jgi:hypothetical protein